MTNFEHDGCKGCRYENETEDSIYCKGCKQNAVDKYVKKTNADRIREMTNEELAEFLLYVNDSCCIPCKVIDEKCKHFGTEKGCKDCFKEWLESECDAEC